MGLHNIQEPKMHQTNNLSIAAACDAVGEECALAVPAASEVSAWQPIETAPTKTPILITDGKIVTVTQLITLSGHMTMNGHGFSGWEYEYDFRYGEVTHWMPLPAAPTTPKE
jgi:hypothetical protein